MSKLDCEVCTEKIDTDVHHSLVGYFHRDCYSNYDDLRAENARLRAELEAVKAERDTAEFRLMNMTAEKNRWKDDYNSMERMWKSVSETLIEERAELAAARKSAAAWKKLARMWRAASTENYRLQARRYEFRKAATK